MKNFVYVAALLLAVRAGAMDVPSTNAPPATNAAPVPEESLTVITSDRLTFDYAQHFAYFEDNVVVTDPQLKILSDKLTVLFDDNNKAKSAKAEGQVYLIQADKKAKSDVATYDVTTGEIVLTGNPQVTRGKDTLTGTKITFWRNENRMKVDSRARLVIYPDSESKSALGGGLLK